MAAFERGSILPFKGIRKIIAQRMRMSMDTAVQANHRMRVDMTGLIEYKEALKEKGIKVSFTDLIVKCVADALMRNPIMNSSLTDEGIVLYQSVNMGIAVAVEKGLVVPVIKNADSMAIEEINVKSTELIEKARNNKLLPDEISGGTFTITNLGMYGIENFTAIINPPEVGILAIGSVVKTPVVDDQNNIVVKPLMELSLTYDHRIVDGAPAADFLRSVKNNIQGVGNELFR